MSTCASTMLYCGSERSGGGKQSGSRRWGTGLGAALLSCCRWECVVGVRSRLSRVRRLGRVSLRGGAHMQRWRGRVC